MPTKTKRPNTKSRGAAGRAAASTSWLALVAATTLGVSEVRSVRTTVQARDAGIQGDDICTLVVQSYAVNSLTGEPGASPGGPLASAQRAVTREQLAQGVDVQLFHVGLSGSDEPNAIVAWLEPGSSELELDGLSSRPKAGATWASAAGQTKILVSL